MPRSAWGLELITDEDWQARAACGPDTAELFWPAFGQGRPPNVLPKAAKAALDICASCPVKRQCLEHAATNPEPYPRIAGGRLWMGRKGNGRPWTI